MLTEKEAEEYREASEKGRQAKIALEFMKEYLMNARASIFHDLENLQNVDNVSTLTSLILFLQVLRSFENTLVRYADTGEIAEKRLNESDG